MIKLLMRLWDIHYEANKEKYMEDLFEKYDNN